MGLSQALGTAASGLRATQSSLSLVAANIANAATPGYIRKTSIQASTASAGAAPGVQTLGVARELDLYVQRQLRTEQSGGAYADLRAQFYQRLQQIYGDPTSPGSIEVTFNSFTSALQGLAASPADPVARRGALSAAQMLTQTLNILTSDIQALRGDAEHGIADSVRDVNNALAGIAQINKQLLGTNAND